jgi:tetratricopeptide (TPR) repeat protein
MLDDDGLYTSLRRVEAVTCYEIGYTFSQANRFLLAADYFRMALQAEPRYYPSFPSLALALDRAGQKEEAIHYYNEALKYFPDRPLLHYNLGAIYHRQGRRDQALLRYREALRLDPKLKEAQQGIDALQGTPQR